MKAILIGTEIGLIIGIMLLVIDLDMSSYHNHLNVFLIAAFLYAAFVLHTSIIKKDYDKI